MLDAARDAAPDLPPGGFEMEYVAEAGTRHKAPFAEAAVVRFAAMLPARRFKARKGQRHLPGQVLAPVVVIRTRAPRCPGNDAE
jgi:hypothetical protein